MHAFFVTLLAAVVVSNAQKLDNACKGFTGQYARDLSDCSKYFYCQNGNPTSGNCDNGQMFSAEKQLCFGGDKPADVCFSCPKREYSLTSVPFACSQYIQCYQGKATLFSCPGNLVFDGRTGIHQCNFAPANNQCNRENSADIEYTKECPNVGNDKPAFLADPTDKNAYYICYGQKYPVRGTCPLGLQFDVDNGVCSTPKFFSNSLHFNGSTTKFVRKITTPKIKSTTPKYVA